MTMNRVLALAAPAVGFIQIEVGGDGDMGSIFEALMGKPQRRITWPDDVASTIDDEYKWLVNSEWQDEENGISFKLNKDGSFESDLDDCDEGRCLWAANNGQLLVMTGEVKRPHTFNVDAPNSGIAQMKSTKEKTKAMQKVQLRYTKDGVVQDITLSFVGFADQKRNAEEDSLVAKDLYEVLGLECPADPRDFDESKVKRVYRKLSIQHHPDKGGDAETFREITQAYEVLSDSLKRKAYHAGAMLLVKKVEDAWKEAEMSAERMEAQIEDQFPRGHPFREAAKAKVEAQTDPERRRRAVIESNTADPIVVEVPFTIADAHRGTMKEFSYDRYVIVRGCRENPDAPECQATVECPSETRQVGRGGLFGGPVKEEEVFSGERCRIENTFVKRVYIPRGCQEGSKLGVVDGLGHETPGKFPGAVVLKAVRAKDDEFSVANEHLFTVLNVSVEDALFGATMVWEHFDGEDREFVVEPATQSGDIFRVRGAGLRAGDRSDDRGDLFIRIQVNLPKLDGASSYTISKPSSSIRAAKLTAETDVDISKGKMTRVFTVNDANANRTSANATGHDEL